MYYLAQGITHRGVGGAYISAEENHPPCARISPPGLSRPPARAPRSPRSTALSIHLLAAHSRPPPSNHPLARSLCLARVLSRSLSLSPSFTRARFTPLTSLYHRSPRHTLFSLPPPLPPPPLPPPAARSHPPKTPLTPTYPSYLPFSLLYTRALPFPRARHLRPPTPLAAASIRRSDSPQRQPPAEGGCALLAPESSRPRPRGGRGDGPGRAEGRAGG